MITSTTTRVTYSGDGATAAFSVPFKFLADGDLVVVLRTAMDFSGAETYTPSVFGGPYQDYSIGDIVRGVHPDHTDNIYRCTIAGQAHVSAGPLWLNTPTGTGSEIVTGTTLTWTYVAQDSGVEERTLATHYTVLGAGDESGGSITFLADFIPESYEMVVIYNDPALTQNVDYVSGDSFPAETHETALDRVTLQQKRTREIAERAPRLPDTDLDGAGAYDARRNRIKNLSAPTRVDDAATKTYVDTAVTNAAFSEPTGIVATGSSTPRDLADRWAQDRNPMDFGAAGTGLVNDSDALQDCLDAVAASGGRMVFPFQKTFLCKNLTFSAVGAFPFIIEGNGSTLKAMSDLGLTDAMISNTSTGGAYSDTDVIIRDLIFDGNGVGAGGTRRSTALVILSKIDRVLLDNCRVTNVEYIGVNLGSRKVLINDCEFDNTGWSGSTSNGGPAVWIASASGDGATKPEDVIVRGCHFHDCDWIGIHFSVTRGIVENCIFHNLKEAALYASHTVHAPVADVQFINNVIDGIVRHDISAVAIEWTADRFRISGNIFTNCQQQAIALGACAYGDVSNNVIGNIGRVDVDSTCDLDSDTTFTMDDVQSIGGTPKGQDVAVGTQVIHASIPQDTFVESINVGTDTVTMTAAATANAENTAVTFVSGGTGIMLNSSGTDDRLLRNIKISNNVFYDDNAVPVTRAGINLIGAYRVENISITDNIFGPELLNNKQSAFDVFQHFGDYWFPSNGNILDNNIGLNKNITKASSAWFTLSSLNIGNDQTFVVTGSVSMQKAQFGRAGMKMTLIWGAGATFTLLHEYGGTSDRFVLKNARNAENFQANDSITLECVEVVTTDATCDVPAPTGTPNSTRSGTDGVAVSSDATFTSASASFATSDVGRSIRVEGAGAGGARLYTKIASRTSATEVELAVAPGTSVNPATWTIASAVACDDSSGLKIGMSVAGPGIPRDSWIGAKPDGTRFELYSGGATIYVPVNPTASGTNVTLTFTERIWHETSRSVNELSVITFSAGDATPTVSGGEMFLTAGTTAITDFDDGRIGQTITVKAKTSITITDGGDLELEGNFAMTTGDTITLKMLETDKWSEISRSDNA